MSQFAACETKPNELSERLLYKAIVTEDMTFPSSSHQESPDRLMIGWSVFMAFVFICRTSTPINN